MKAVPGSNVDVRALTETMLIKVKDIDEITEDTEDLASLVTGCVYLVLCDFCQFVINICVTGALLCVLVQHNQPCLCFKSSVYV